MHDSTLDKVFKISIILKGLDALLEIVSGIFLLFVSPDMISHFVNWLTRSELAKDPHDYIATLLTHSTSHLGSGTTLYGAIYLLIHGVVKIFVIINVFRQKLWAYPLLIVVLFFFIIYQVIDIVTKHSITMTLLTAFDLFIIVLTWIEWNRHKKRINKHKETEKPKDKD